MDRRDHIAEVYENKLIYTLEYYREGATLGLQLAHGFKHSFTTEDSLTPSQDVDM